MIGQQDIRLYKIYIILGQHDIRLYLMFLALGQQSVKLYIWASEAGHLITDDIRWDNRPLDLYA